MNKEVKEVVDAIIDGNCKGMFGMSLIARGEVNGLRKKDCRAAGVDPSQVWKVTKVTNPLVGWSYEKVVNERREEGEPEFHAQPMKGKVWIKGYEGFISKSITKDTEYLRTYATTATHYDTTYMIGQRPATEDEVTIIKNCITPPSPSAAQSSIGVEKQVVVRDYTIANIISIDFEAAFKRAEEARKANKEAE